MSTPLVPSLSFSRDNATLPLAGQLLLITDHLPSPADFILHRALALHLKQQPSQRRHVVLVSLACELAHWRAIAAKSNVNLEQHMKAGSLTYIDALSFSSYRHPRSDDDHNTNTDEAGYIRCPPLSGAGGDEPPLKGLYDVIAQSLHRDADASILQQQRTVILDDLTLPEFVGVPSVAITRFLRALRALCRRHTAALIVRAHASSPPPSDTDASTPFDSDLLRALIDACHAHIEVRPLVSGRSGAVSGEIAIHMGGLGSVDSGGSWGVGEGRKRSVQYRLTDGGPVFFQKGMAAGVL